MNIDQQINGLKRDYRRLIDRLDELTPAQFKRRAEAEGLTIRKRSGGEWWLNPVIVARRAKKMRRTWARKRREQQ